GGVLDEKSLAVCARRSGTGRTAWRGECPVRGATHALLRDAATSPGLGLLSAAGLSRLRCAAVSSLPSALVSRAGPVGRPEARCPRIWFAQCQWRGPDRNVQCAAIRQLHHVHHAGSLCSTGGLRSTCSNEPASCSSTGRLERASCSAAGCLE